MTGTRPIAADPGLSVVIALLDAVGLPHADLTDGHMPHFFYCGPRSAPIALVGVELRGSHALLRSLAVKPAHRSRGLGAALVGRAERHARDHGALSMYLLTTTAEDFFRRQGYVIADRARAPDEIRATREYSTLCPESAAFLVKDLHAR